MKRWILASLGAAVLLGFIVAALLAAQDYRDRQLEKAAVQADEAVIVTLQKEFPIGMTMPDVHAGLRARELDSIDYNGEILLRQGTQPSFLWYCGPYTRYVIFRFSSGPDGDLRLTSIVREVRGLSCL